MATPLELYTIEKNAELAFVEGEAAAVTQARELSIRVRQAVIRSASAILADQANPQGNTGLLDALAYARNAVRSPDSEKIPIFRMVLAGLPANRTVAQILDPTSLTDQIIDTRVGEVLARLAKGTYR